MDDDYRRDEVWAERPALMAVLGAVAGLIFYMLTDHSPDAAAEAIATFVGVATISFILTAEKLRLHWAALFAVGWGLVVALIGWSTARYNLNPTIFEFPFFSGIFAVLLAAPLFQTVRDEGGWRFPYARVHRNVWTDAVIGAAGLAFVGASFLLGFLISQLFHLIGIDVVKQLMESEWFDWMLAGAAFGAAVGILRERDALAAGLWRLVTVVLAVLAPVLAAALALFLLSLPFTGLDGLWKSGVPTTPLLLFAAGAAFVLANDVLGAGRGDRAPGRLMQTAALVLVLSIAPLAVIAAISMGLRIGQYGWTPERFWGVIAAAIALAYGAAAILSVATRRMDFDEALRPMQVRLAIGICGMALFLALPILDFGAISARSQMARFASGKVKVAEFDWRAMAQDFGPAGRNRLEAMAKTGPEAQRKLASAALRARTRYEVNDEIRVEQAKVGLDARVRVLPEGTRVEPALRDAMAASDVCGKKPCVAFFAAPDRVALIGHPWSEERIQIDWLQRGDTGLWGNATNDIMTSPENKADIGTAPVEVRDVTFHQLFVGGKPAGPPFE